ncbi:alkaline phosphatase family protein [Brevibacterium litoralis]|uniref:alkaline phosphatase family protein n=1 Tax=Brevibacterium litoralis TaxID=3138935 RepID=UPI0032EECC52
MRDPDRAGAGGPGGGANTTASTVDYLTNGNFDALFVHLDEVDGAGHSCGYVDCPADPAELADVDQQIGQILDAVESRATYAEEDWQIILMSDHGHTPTGGHGGNTPEERATFVLTVGGGAEAGAVRHDVELVDIAPSALAHLGTEIDPEWDLDGYPFAEIPEDPFDSTLVSPEYPLDGSGRIDISYASNYQVDGPQTGETFVVFDGGEPQLLKEYTVDENIHEELTVNPPEGAETVQLRFRYTGSNSYYWALDLVQVSQQDPSNALVTGVEIATENVDEAGFEMPWRVDAELDIESVEAGDRNGRWAKALEDATVTAELRFDGKETELTGTTDKKGHVTLTGYAMYTDSAEFAITSIEKDGVVWHGDADTVETTVTVERPTD